MLGRRYFHFYKNFSFNFLTKRMGDAERYKNLEAKAVEAENLVLELRAELATLKTVVNAVKNAGVRSNHNYEDLMKENETLKKEVDFFKSQIRKDSPILAVNQSSNAAIPNQTQVQESKKEPEQTNATPKAAKEKKAAPKPVVAEAPVDFGRLDIRVGKIIDVKKHPDADSLYVEQVDVGEDKPRTVISGLVKHVPIEEMQNRMVVLLCNLKPAKMRGILSEAMVMCASTPEKVEILSPPAGSVPGDIVLVDGYPRLPDTVLNPKQKIFETVAPDLKTSDGKLATYRGVPWLVPGKGNVISATLNNVNIK